MFDTFFIKTVLLSPAEGQDIQNMVLKAHIHKAFRHLSAIGKTSGLD